ncbi:cohesin [Encephalitozoon romaleae SJ-2008]|uniref:Cohesin n=1 Tax=Encephalitozoon romaleae (strain SJ-2008) TaxID=1178016 RepID=I7AMC4_ENCRO|nr:cohesin [Encephalitozoon romaleae SJ-2008]AFN82849.1 cohesin [Encephalitozoon romaleae SJ-2008]
MEKENNVNESEVPGTACDTTTHNPFETSEDGCCPFDVFTPEALTDRLRGHEDCTKDIIKIIKSIHVNQCKMKKLCKVFNSVSNYNTDSIVELTRDANRMLRYVSTYLMLDKIKQWVVDGRGFEVVETMYDEVFLVRFRDVDFNIRSICVGFMCEWIVSAPEIFNFPCYLKYIGWSLSDKNDNVRRKGVGACIKLVRKKVDIQTFVSRFKNRMIELSLYDRNFGLRGEGKVLCMSLYINGMISKDDVYKVLGSMNEKDKKLLVEDTIRKILKREGSSDECLLDNHEGLHELFSNTSLFLCSCIPHSDKDVEGFIDFILDFLRTKSSCCQSRTLCYLKILGVLSVNMVDLRKYYSILETVRDNRENTREAMASASKLGLKVFKRQPDITNDLLEMMRELSIQYKCEEMFSSLVCLLKKLESDFPVSVYPIVESSGSSCIEFLRCTIKSFDISKGVGNEHPSEIKCYAALWRTMANDYERVNKYELKDIDNPGVLCDFLIFFKEKCIEFGMMNLKVEQASDQGECFKVMYDKLFALIHSKAESVFIDPGSCISLFKLVDEGLLLDYSYIIFRECGVELISEFLNKSKSKMNLVSGYFRYLMDVEEKDVDKGVGKLIGSKCSMAKRGIDIEKVVFRGMKGIVEQKKTFLYDAVLIYFVSSLTTNECIILEQGLEKSRLKMSLLRRIRDG